MHSRKSHHTLKKIPTYSFHSTPTTLKKQNLDRRMKAMAKDLSYKGQVKLQQMQEEAVKQGINIGASRRMSLVSANDVMDYTLPFKFSQLPVCFELHFSLPTILKYNIII
jgi:hypothetical protein